MAAAGFSDRPARAAYDVVIVGGAAMGSSAAWWLTGNPDFAGRVLVVERDPSYAQCSTAHTNSCIRQQFSSALNVRISQFGAAFVQNLKDWSGGDDRAPRLKIQNFGYMYLADTPAFAEVLRASQKVQAAAGAATRLMTAEEIGRAYPFYRLDDILLGSHNTVDEGYFDGAAVFDWQRRQARARGAEYVADEVVAMTLNPAGDRVESVTLAGGDIVACGHVVNAAGPRAARVAALAGLSLPVEPRKRFTWIFRAARPLDRPLPLTIDPSGVHMREVGGGTYMCGGHADIDAAAAADDFAMDPTLWEEKIWPALAARVPQFEAVKVTHEWAGHYAMNTLDRNAVIGPHDEVGNFIFLNGFSGHGLQQAPAMGRGAAELLTYGEYRTLDLGPFGYDRIRAGRAFPEDAII